MVKGGELTMDNKTNDTSGSVTIWPTNARVRQEVVASQKLDNVQTVIKKLQTDTNIVAGLVKKSNRLLLSISTHRFPIDIFPDTINIEESRITFITRDFFLSSQVHSIDIKDITNIFINTSPFYAQLAIISKTFKENEIRVSFLRKKEAIFARRIIEGLRTFESKQVDTSRYTKEELIAKLEELSTTAIVT